MPEMKLLRDLSIALGDYESEMDGEPPNVGCRVTLNGMTYEWDGYEFRPEGA